MDFSSKKLLTMCKTFKTIDESYSFNMELHKIAIHNYGVKPAVTPFIWQLVHETNGAIPTCEQLLAFYKKNKQSDIVNASHLTHSQDLLMKAKIRQIWTGFLREVHVIITLNKADPDGIITKDVEADLSDGGYDIWYINSNNLRDYYFAVTHSGYMSTYYEKNRKNAKRKSDCIVLTAKSSKTSKLDLVNEDDILIAAGLKRVKK